MSDFTAKETADAFANLANLWSQACIDEMKHKLDPEVKAELLGMANAYARIARVASETAESMKGETIPNPTAAYGAIPQHIIRKLYNENKNG